MVLEARYRGDADNWVRNPGLLQTVGDPLTSSGDVDCCFVGRDDVDVCTGGGLANLVAENGRICEKRAAEHVRVYNHVGVGSVAEDVVGSALGRAEPLAAPGAIAGRFGPAQAIGDLVADQRLDSVGRWVIRTFDDSRPESIGRVAEEQVRFSTRSVSVMMGRALRSSLVI